MLARTVAAWGWETETVDLLWILAKSDETKLEALQTLYQHYAKLGDTTGLYRTLLRLVEALPNDLTLQNNLAQISLLLGADVERARKVAAEIKSKEPSNGAYVSTYAFSLYTKGDVKGALQAMDQLSPDQLRDPSVADVLWRGSGSGWPERKSARVSATCCRGKSSARGKGVGGKGGEHPPVIVAASVADWKPPSLQTQSMS